MHFFNTAGPIKPDLHYCLPPLARFDLELLLSLIAQQKYFVLHAPRQTGKTSCLLALADYLNAGDKYRCVYFNVEVGQGERENTDRAIRNILGELAIQARIMLDDHFVEHALPEVLAQHGSGALGVVLTRWAEQRPHPLVLLIDEIDSLVGDTLISVLRQLRTGYTRRPQHFPHSILLCGVRDVRDYRIHSSSEQAIITGGSAFNIKAESLRLGDFSRVEMDRLYLAHTQETGQVFLPATLDRLWELTQGQPWLVNALGYETCFKMPVGRDRSQPITVALVDEAKENLILRRETHLDQLADKLHEERVRRVIEPLLTSQEQLTGVPPDDVDYVRDLGLIGPLGPGREARIANPIYREVIPRQLTYSTVVMTHQEAAWYLAADGRLEMPKLLTAFQTFFREHSEHWVERFQYREAGPQLLLQAFLQRIVNGGGRIEREYGLGRMRTDLLILWFYPGGTQKVVIEVKLLHKSLAKTLEQGLLQTWEYLDRCAAEEGHLVIFDRTPGKAWEEKLFQQQEIVRDRTILIWGM